MDTAWCKIYIAEGAEATRSKWHRLVCLGLAVLTGALGCLVFPGEIHLLPPASRCRVVDVGQHLYAKDRRRRPVPVRSRLPDYVKCAKSEVSSNNCDLAFALISQEPHPAF